MVRWMPEWLARNYFKLHQEFDGEYGSTRPFAFPEAVNSLKVSKQVAQKTLWELELRGFVTKRRSETNYRNRVYQMIQIADVMDALKSYFKFKKGQFEKLSLVKKICLLPWDYVLAGSSAAAYYHGYQSTGRVLKLMANPSDYGKIIALLSSKDTVVSTEAGIEYKRAKYYVRLLSLSYDWKELIQPAEDGVNIERREYLLIDFLKQGTLASANEGVALIATNSKKINWSEVITLAEKNNLRRELGCLLDIINLEARKPVVEPGVVLQLEATPATNWFTEFPAGQAEAYKGISHKIESQKHVLSKTELGELEEKRSKLVYYHTLGKKWVLTILLPRDVIRKTLQDLGVELSA